MITLKRFLSLMVVLGLLSGVPVVTVAQAASVGDAIPGTKKQFKLKTFNQKQKPMNCKSKRAQRKNKRCTATSSDTYNR